MNSLKKEYMYVLKSEEKSVAMTMVNLPFNILPSILSIAMNGMDEIVELENRQVRMNRVIWTVAGSVATTCFSRVFDGYMHEQQTASGLVIYG